MAFTLLVNGSEHHVEAAPEDTLLSVLRDRLELTARSTAAAKAKTFAPAVHQRVSNSISKSISWI